ncbi:MAG: transketolase [Clostridia bacterium]|nr:transketolase [Clostridia bacterium]
MEEKLFLQNTAKKLRKLVIEMIGAAGSGHPGGSLSSADLLTALYFSEMRVDPQNPNWPERDRLVLSKGHAAPTLYAALAEKGFFPLEKLKTLRQLGSELQGHPDFQLLPGLDISSGSLGQGLSIANGMALAARLNKANWRVFALLGDGETQEGQVWEAAMAAAHYGLDNLTALIDCNKLQIDGQVQKVMGIEPIKAKWQAFGWEVLEIDGHDFEQILEAFRRPRQPQKPRMIIAQTVKGKGVSFMENQAGWHGKAPQGEELNQALAELN